MSIYVKLQASVFLIFFFMQNKSELKTIWL